MNQAYVHPQNQGLAPAARRNVGLIAVGIVVGLLAMGAGVVFLINLNQYLSIEERWSNDPLLSPEARRFGVALIRQAALKRMTLFGPLSGGLGVLGLALFVIGLRKK